MSGVIAVVRAAGERTLPACLALLRRDLPSTPIHVVREQPFEEALRACYRIGMESQAEWMLTVDADVLPRRGAVDALLAEARRLPSTVAQVEGLVHDRLFGGLRKAGHRIYRTASLPCALQAVPADGTTIRPEFATLQALAASGQRSHECAVVFGLHAYEQFFADLYRTAFVHAQKHAHWMVDVVPRWRENAHIDAELKVALRGFCDGLQSVDAARIDKRMYTESAARALEDLGLSERADLSIDDEQLDGFDRMQPSLLTGAASTRERLASNYRRLGLVRVIPHLTGGVLLAIGHRLRRLAEER